MKTQTGIAHWRHLPELFLLLAGIIIYGVAAWNLHVPGYMDAEYYFMNGQRIASGEGFTEMVIWNYLDDPQGLPHSSHTYWLPFTSVVAAFGLFLFRNQNFIFAQIPFVVISAFIPVLTYRIGLLLHGDNRKALLGGALGLFSGYYLAYQTTTSSLGLYMLEGGLFFWLLLLIMRGRPLQLTSRACLAGLGGVCGIMHLTRSDGVLWLFIGLLFSLYYGFFQKKDNRRLFDAPFQRALPFLLVFAGYVLVMAFWFVHNFQLFGSIMPKGGTLTLWLNDYNQTFSYPASNLNFSNWLETGIGNILSIRLESSWDNLQSLVAVEGEIILLPLFITGFLVHRKAIETRVMLFVWLLTFVLMSWVFPFAGMRGGFFHSSAAFQPFIWSMIPAGFDKFIQWGAEKRKWNVNRAWRNFGIILCAMMAIFTAGIYYGKVIGSNPEMPAWGRNHSNYVQVEQAVREVFPDICSVIIVNNPPGYFLASGGRPAVVLPDGNDQTLKWVAEKFNAKIVAIDRDTVDGLKHLYLNPVSTDWLEYLFTSGDTRIYRVKEMP